MLDPERPRIVKRPVADQEERREAISSRHYQRFHPVHPSRAAAAAKGPRPNGAGVLDDFELRVLAVGDDVLGIEFPIRDHLRQLIHYLGIGSDRIRGNDVDIGQFDGM